jgi:hypothetical protein
MCKFPFQNSWKTYKDKIVDTKGVIRSHRWKDRQYNTIQYSLKKSMVHKTLLKIDQATWTPLKT